MAVIAPALAILAGCAQQAPTVRACGATKGDPPEQIAWAQAYDTRCDAGEVEALRQAACGASPAPAAVCGLTARELASGRFSIAAGWDLAHQPPPRHGPDGSLELIRFWTDGMHDRSLSIVRVTIRGAADEDAAAALRFATGTAWRAIAATRPSGSFARVGALDRGLADGEPVPPRALPADAVEIFRGRARFLEGDLAGAHAALAAALDARLAGARAEHPQWRLTLESSPGSSPP